MADSRLLLVDGMAVVYRAFYAIRELSTSSGRPTNAVFGFIRMLGQMRDAWKPSHWIVVFDGGLSAEKVALLREYKAQRPPMPDALRQQIGTIEEYLDRAGVCRIRQDGQEADDVIASIAASADERAGEILIATSDKDLCQLVGGKTKLVPISGVSEPAGPEAVKARTGVSPSQIIEWLALVGDASDNIPGVPGIGPKTAAKLMDEYGSLRGIWAHLEEVGSGRIRKALDENRDLIARNVAMVKLRKDLGIAVDWDLWVVRSPEAAKLATFFDELEFKTMARDLRQTDLFSGWRHGETGGSAGVARGG